MKILSLLEQLKLDSKKIALIALVSLAVLYIDFSLVIKSQINSIRDSRPKIAKLKSDMDKLTRDLTNMQDLKTRPVKIKEGAVVKAKRVVSEEQVASLLEKISQVGNKNNIKIMQIKPNREPPGKKEAAAVKEAVKFAPLFINLDLVCSYHNLGSFLNQIEQAEELMTVDGIKIESDPTNYLQQRVNLVLRAYVKK